MEIEVRNASSSEEPNPPRGRLSKSLWVAAGTFFLFLGLVGVVLPVLPTAPFLLLAVACYLRGSKRMHDWVMANRLLGPYLRNYREGRGIPLTVAFALSDPILQIAIVVIAVAVTVHIASIKTLGT